MNHTNAPSTNRDITCDEFSKRNMNFLAFGDVPHEIGGLFIILKCHIHFVSNLKEFASSFLCFEIDIMPNLSVVVEK